MSRASDNFMSCELPTCKTVKELSIYGVEIPVFDRFQLIGLANVELVPGGLFEVSPYGTKAKAYVTPIRAFGDREYEHSNPDAVVLNGDIVDLVCWHPAMPGRWALLTGAARVLGCVGPQMMLPDPVPVHRNILNWMRCGRQGLVLLTRDDREVAEILRTIETIVAEDPIHQAELKRLASQPWPTPNVIARTAA